MATDVDRRLVLKGATAAMIMAVLRDAGTTAQADAVRAPSTLGAGARRAFAANQTITTLVAGRLYRVGCMVRAERLSWLPADLDAYEPVNFYVMVDKDNCVFVEMGLPVARPALQNALDTLVDKRKVWVSFSRNEADCIGNMGYILGSCENPTLLFGGAGGILEWVNDPHVSILEVRDFLGRIPIESSKNGESKKIGDMSFHWFNAGLKMMLMTQWTYEDSTGCLFTSESFGFRHAATMDSPVVIESAKNLPSADTVAREMVARMNWLREADYPDYGKQLKAIFETHDVQMIAPVHGCVLKGRDVVAAHLKLTLEALRLASKIPDYERMKYV